MKATQYLRHIAPFEIETMFYVVKNTKLQKYLILLSYKFSTFHTIQRIIVKIAENFVFLADKNTGRHLVCVCRVPNA